MNTTTTTTPQPAPLSPVEGFAVDVAFVALRMYAQGEQEATDDIEEVSRQVLADDPSIAEPVLLLAACTVKAFWSGASYA